MSCYSLFFIFSFCSFCFLVFFFFNDPPPTEIYTLSLHDALPISMRCPVILFFGLYRGGNSYEIHFEHFADEIDRKSTRLNSSHRCISYAVFCLKKKKKNK